VITGRPKPVGQLHQPDRLAIAFGLGHAEIVPEAARRVVALFVTDQDDLPALKPAQPADDRLVVAECAIAGQWDEIIDQAGNIILEMRPLRVPRDQGLLPGR
jgi:hypothetical protein